MSEESPKPVEYPIDKETQKCLDRNFTYHAPKGDQIYRYGEIRGTAKNLVALILRLCPSSREQSLALTKIEEAVMWSNSAIARNE